MNEIEKLKIALEESVKLQSHYAKLLNMYDAGERIGFRDADAWLQRLDEIGTFKEKPNPHWTTPEEGEKVGGMVMKNPKTGEIEHYDQIIERNKETGKLEAVFRKVK